MAPMIQLTQVEKVYRLGGEALHVLREVTLSVTEGEYLAVMGPSGSGKSTLMHILGCLDIPTAGRYELEGRDVSTLSDHALSRLRRDHIGFVFQNFNLLPSLTALENVALPLMYRGWPVARQMERARDLLERVGLSERARHRPGELSGGQQQRVAIARALAADAGLLLADEPTGNLDSHSGQEILDLFGDLHLDGHTIVLITHDAEVASRAGRLVEVRDGRVVDDRKGSA